MLIYNARSLHKFLIILYCGGIDFVLIFASVLGGIYKNNIQTLVIMLVVISVALLGFIIYLLLRKFANSVFLFDDEGFTRKINKRVVLRVKWDNVISIGTYRIYDLLKIDIGPMFLGIDYYDENKNRCSLQVAFSKKDARRLKFSHLNKKLDNII